MACGRPVLTSNVSSARDAINQAAYGSVVEPRTATAFADAMQAAAQTTYDEKVIRHYAEQNSWEKWADNAIRLFGALVEK
jgi:glycosyltransferase involved in cell wall biosynthesis